MDLLVMSILVQIHIIELVVLYPVKQYSIYQFQMSEWMLLTTTNFQPNIDSFHLQHFDSFYTAYMQAYRSAIITREAVQRWPRDARYISRSWAVADIYPFEIIQDGGDRHLEFVWIEKSVIRSAVPENPTL